MDTYLIIVCCVLPVCVTMFALTRRKRNIQNDITRETLSYNLKVKHSKSAFRKKNKTPSRKSVQFNEVVLEVFDLINEEEPEDILQCKPSYPKIVKSSLKHEKVYVPVRYSNTVYPKTVINEYNGDIISLNKNKEEKQTEQVGNTKFVSTENEYPEILIIKNENDPIMMPKPIPNEKKEDNTLIKETVNNSIAETVITSEAKSDNYNIINSPKSNTFPRRSRPNYKGHRRQSSVRLKCIY